MFTKKSQIIGVFAAAVGTLVGCSKKEAPYVERSVNELYNEAMDQMAARQFKKAAKNFDEVERQHPYSPWAARAMLMSAFAYFQVREYDKALNSAEAFIQLHPGHEDVAYAYYLIALCYYDQISQVDHDQKATELAQKALDDVIRRFPHTPYGRDARLKMALVRDHLAGKHVDVGRYYMKTNAFVAAANRFLKVVEKFQDTSYVEEALYRLVEAYIALGVKDQALATGAVLGHNYPGGVWYAQAYELLHKHYSHEDFNKISIQKTGTPLAAPQAPITQKPLTKAPAPITSQTALPPPPAPETQKAVDKVPSVMPGAKTQRATGAAGTASKP